MVDNGCLDYLMPTCMQSPGNLRYQASRVSSPRSTLDIYHDCLEALETDTCSEYSDMSYAQASDYTKMKISSCKSTSMYEDSGVTRGYYDRIFTKSLFDGEPFGSQFSRSLKQFLEWPDPSVCAEMEIDAAIQTFESREGLRIRLRGSDRKKKSATKVKSLYPRKPIYVAKYVETDSDCAPESDNYESDKETKVPDNLYSDMVSNSEILRHNLVKPKSDLDKPQGSFDSDSDYRTLSDTSSEKIDPTFAQFGDSFVDLTPLKELIVATTEQADSFTSKLAKSELFRPILNKRGYIGKSQELVRTLGKKEGELEGFQDLLRKAQQSLAQCEHNVESLDRQLKEERESKVSGDEAAGLRERISQLHGQLQDREREYQSKCKQLDDLSNLLQKLLNSQPVHNSILEEILVLLRHMVPHNINIHIDQPTNGNQTSDHMTTRLNMTGGEVTNGKQSPDHMTSLCSISSDSSSDANDGGAFSGMEVPENKSNRTSPHMTKAHRKPVVVGKSGIPVPAMIRRHSAIYDMTDGQLETEKQPEGLQLESLKQLENLKQQVLDLEAEKEHLTGMLKATESTVYCQTHKMKKFRSMLIEHGLLPRSRSHSLDITDRRSSTPAALEAAKIRGLPTERQVSPASSAPGTLKSPLKTRSQPNLSGSSPGTTSPRSSFGTTSPTLSSGSTSPQPIHDVTSQPLSPETIRSQAINRNQSFGITSPQLIHGITSLDTTGSQMINGNQSLRATSQLETNQRVSLGATSPQIMNSTTSPCGSIRNEVFDDTSSCGIYKNQSVTLSPPRISGNQSLTATSPGGFSGNQSLGTNTCQHGTTSLGLSQISNPRGSYGNQSFGTSSSQAIFGNQSLGATSPRSKTGNQSFGTTSPQALFGNQSLGATGPRGTTGNQSFGTTSPQAMFGNQSLGATSPRGTTGNQSFGTTSPRSTNGSLSFGATSPHGTPGYQSIGTTSPRGANGNQSIGTTSPRDTTSPQGSGDNVADNAVGSGYGEAVKGLGVCHSVSIPSQLLHDDTLGQFDVTLDNDATDSEKLMARQGTEPRFGGRRLSNFPDMLSTTMSVSFVQDIGDTTMLGDTSMSINQGLEKDKSLQLQIKNTLNFVMEKMTRVEQGEASSKETLRQLLELLRRTAHQLDRSMEENELLRQQLHHHYFNTRKVILEQDKRLAELAALVQSLKDQLNQKDGKIGSLEEAVSQCKDSEIKLQLRLSHETSHVTKLNNSLQNTQQQLIKTEKNLRGKVETLSQEKMDLVNELSGYKLTNMEYKAQITQQLEYANQLEDKIMDLNNDLAKTVESRDDLSNQLDVVNKLKEKYLKNAKKLYDELARTKRLYRHKERSLTETMAIFKQYAEKLESKTLTTLSAQDCSDITEVMNQLRKLNQQLPTYVDKQNEIHSDVKATLEAEEPNLEHYLHPSSPRKKDNPHDVYTTTDNSSCTVRSRETTSGSSLSGSLQQSCFSIPGPIYKQGITDECLRYSVHDSPEHLARLTNVRIDSDVRCLFAVGMIDHMEKLHKETCECKVILRGMSTRVGERLKMFVSLPATEMLKSQEYSTLKEIAYCTENLRICCDSQLSMISCFWTSELPAPNENSEFVNKKQLRMIASLKEEIAQLRNKCKSVSTQEESICKSLESTLDVVSQARHNLQAHHSPRR